MVYHRFRIEMFILNFGVNPPFLDDPISSINMFAGLLMLPMALEQMLGQFLSTTSWIILSVRINSLIKRTVERTVNQKRGPGFTGYLIQDGAPIR